MYQTIQSGECCHPGRVEFGRLGQWVDIKYVKRQKMTYVEYKYSRAYTIPQMFFEVFVRAFPSVISTVEHAGFHFCPVSCSVPTPV